MDDPRAALSFPDAPPVLLEDDPSAFAVGSSTGWTTWNASMVLCQYLQQHPPTPPGGTGAGADDAKYVPPTLPLAGLNVSDLSSGNGLVALCAARLGARSVIATETDACTALTRRNVLLNALGDRVRVAPFYWGDAPCPACDGCDLVLFCDLLYIAIRDGLEPQLEDTVRRVCASGAHVLFAFEERALEEEEAFMARLIAARPDKSLLPSTEGVRERHSNDDDGDGDSNRHRRTAAASQPLVCSEVPQDDLDIEVCAPEGDLAFLWELPSIRIFRLAAMPAAAAAWVPEDFSALWAKVDVASTAFLAAEAKATAECNEAEGDGGQKEDGNQHGSRMNVETYGKRWDNIYAKEAAAARDAAAERPSPPLLPSSLPPPPAPHEWHSSWAKISSIAAPYLLRSNIAIKAVADPSLSSCDRGRTVLDVGCGTSTLGTDLLAHCCCGNADAYGFTSLLLLDASTTCVAQLRAAHADDPRIACVVGDCRSLPYPDESCHCVLDKGTLDALDAEADQIAMLRECARVLAPGGVIVSVSFGAAHRLELLARVLPALGLAVDVFALESNAHATATVFLCVMFASAAPPRVPYCPDARTQEQLDMAAEVYPEVGGMVAVR